MPKTKLTIQEALEHRLGTSAKEFHQLTGISLVSIYRHMADNSIPHVTIGSRKLIKNSYLQEILGGTK